MTRAENHFGSSLLDKSKANPANVNKEIFKKTASGASGNQPLGQGTVSSNYQQQCDEDNPEPESASENAVSVSLANCKITTPLEKLRMDQPFEMSVEVNSPDGKASGSVQFCLFC